MEFPGGHIMQQKIIYFAGKVQVKFWYTTTCNILSLKLLLLLYFSITDIT